MVRAHDFYSFYGCTFSWEIQKWFQNFGFLDPRGPRAQKMAPPGALTFFENFFLGF